MPTFQQLWDSHPMNWTPPESEPCKDKKGKVQKSLENQCAIRMGLALQGAGINTSGVFGARCWNGHGNKHILRVASLLPWIEANTTRIGC